MLDRSLCSLVIIVGIEIKNNPTTLTSLTILTTIMIFTSLSPNTEADDIFLALKILISPWLWVKGRAVKELENTFKQWLGVKYVFAFSSGRTCLYVILSSLGLSKNDEVLLQAYTCVAVPNSIIWAGAKPVYVDCEETIFNMSVEDLKKKITPKSKALIIQHTFGRPTKIDQLMAAAKENNLQIIISHRGSETTDTTLVDLAVACGADYIKVGPTRGERVCKYNRLMEIERELNQD